ncbi:MAG: histidine kinase dimerization/phospho-acceptor domain-containing protein [Smithellaceae bacterium]
MSHEIRTPLNAITGIAYLMKKSETSLTKKMYIEKIIQASNNMLSIIKRHTGLFEDRGRQNGDGEHLLQHGRSAEERCGHCFVQDRRAWDRL